MRNKHITAEVIADSLNEFGNRITSLIVVLPRIVLAEFNTHRMLSRNSSSSRAIPFDTMVNKVRAEPFIPIKWQKNHKGMQGTQYIENEAMVAIRDLQWLSARDAAVSSSKRLSENFYDLNNSMPDNEDREGVTKQLCNRLLEPFLYHTIICTATEWSNFTALRAHPDAEIHIADAAEKVLEAMNTSTPKQLKAGQWHIPFGDKIDNKRLTKVLFNDPTGQMSPGLEAEVKIKIATARCARVSYLNYEGKDDYKADLKLYDRLSSVGHWSPFEHCAKAMTAKEIMEGSTSSNKDGWSGNFRGFIQLRKTFNNENKSDSRLIKK